MVSKGMMSKSMVTMGGGMDGEVARGVDSSAVLFLIVILVNLIRGGSGLGVLGVQLARMHPTLVGRSTNGYVSPVVTLTTHYCLHRAFSIAGSLELQSHP